jgi:hypothetical protein
MNPGWKMLPFPGALMVYRRINTKEHRYADVEQTPSCANYWRVYSHYISLRGTSEGWCQWTVRGRGLFKIDGIPGTFEVLGFIVPPGGEMAA